jgi:imidazolonepropionase
VIKTTAINQPDWDQLWLDVHLATMDKSLPDAYGMIRNAAIAVKEDRIAWIGITEQLPNSLKDSNITTHDGGGRWVTPGLIDCHTHLIYGGDRAEEFELRLTGVSYDKIARRGGGIRSTVTATRNTSEENLLNSAAKRLQYFLNEGVTGIEIKSGYGLDTETELKMLRVARKLGKKHPIEVSTSYLGAHTLPPEYDNSDNYIDWLCKQMLPLIAEQELADAVDVFCESIGFNLPQTEKLFQAAVALELPIKAHVEQLTNMGGSALAARYNALSVDHLEHLDKPGVAAIQSSGSVAVLLPGAFYFLRETKPPPIEQLRDAGVPMAIASDCNPGSSPATSLLLMMNMACTLFRLTPAEALTGVTRHAAQALGWQNKLGTLKVGKQADFVLWDINHPAELAYGIGHNPCAKVIKRGCLITS